ncbi:MAG: glutamate--tRNA ligase family protein [Acetobacteraceae bacterium]
MTAIRLRLALAPTGHLTVNMARAALVNARFAHARRQAGATAHLTLRLDDLNRDRVRPAFAETIAHDLEWLGVVPDETMRQSDRVTDYQDAITRLRDSGRLYPCFESQAELRAKAEQRRRRGKPDLYDRAMLSLTAAQRAAAEAGGKRPYWRFRLSDKTVTWSDRVLGQREAKLTAISDPILVREDGQPAPLLASAIDDRDLAITDLIRPEENVAETGSYLDLLAALGTHRLPCLASVPSVDGAERGGQKPGSRPVRDLRADGVMPAALAAWLTGDTPDTIDWGMLRAIPYPASLLTLNRQVLAGTPFTAVAGYLPPGATEPFWLAVRTDIDLIHDAAHWWDVVGGTIAPPDGPCQAHIVRAALDRLPQTPWDQHTWDAWLTALSEAADAAADQLYPILTGEPAGPPMSRLLPMIGPDRVRRRLREALA